MRLRLNRIITACCAFAALHAAAAHAQLPTPRATLVEPLRLPAYEIPRLGELFASRSFQSWVAEWSDARTNELAAAPQKFLLQARLFNYYNAEAAALEGVEVAAGANAEQVAATTSQDSVDFLPPLPQRRTRENMLGGTLGEYADLGLRIRSEGTLGGAWTRHKPCDPAVYFNCNPGMFPELKPDVQFGILVGGTISERVHVDVDYDQTREFDAANNINVFYQGLQDEILQRVEVGDVSIRLPQSRYLTRGVPAGNFGFMASAQLGPLELQTVFAEQKGDITTREFRFGGGNNAGVEQDAELILDDADYAKGQFFFLVPPSDIPGSPHIDVVALRSTDAPASIRPGLGGNIQVYRDERVGLGGGAGTTQVGRFLAEALPPGGGQRHTGSFARLTAEEHYVLHPSGLWLMLKSPLRADEALAISYVTETGDTIGTLNAESAPAGTTPRLLLLRGPVATHQPGTGTWDMEMHQVYRLDSSNSVDINTVNLQVSLGELVGGSTFRDVLGQQLSFLKFFGLDEDSPADRIDAAHVYQPARDAFGGTTGTPSVGGTYIIFPTLRPFAEPAPLQSIRASAEDLKQALGTDANTAIYYNPDPVNREAAGRFRLNFTYRVKVEGLQSAFNLGAFGIREGSERLRLGGRLLQRGVDYDIDYEIGVITLLDAATLFATTPDAQIDATWEQKPMFAIAPRTTWGASARYAVGSRGELNFVGLFQREKSLISRPQLGMEPGGAFIGGIGGSFDLGGALLDRAVAGLGVRSALASSVKLTGELALSAQNSNRAGVAYLDDFEATDEVGLSVRRQDWKLGSAAESSTGDRGTLPFSLDAASALPLVWQDRWLQNGQVQGALPARTYIDQEIVIAGGDQALEPVMWLTWGWPDGNRPAGYPAPVDARRWRSLTTVLSTTGRDMTRSEYLEFYVSAGATEPLALIFDIGTVSEDAFYADSLGRTRGTREDGRPWGLRTLDAEANPLDREVWGTDRDALGLWDQTCVSEPLATYPLGDPRANCTRSNGINDTEDLNGNGILDGDDGQYFRYVVQLDQLSEYLVRDTDETKTGFRLYRIPLRSGVPVNGANDGTWRFVRHLRMTIAGEPNTVRQLSLARMRIVGSRWTKRDVHGIMAGNFDAEPGAGALTGEVRVGPVSRLTDGLDYEAPPGVNEELQDRSQQYGTTGFEINEKSLRMAYDGLQPDQRAEVYFRYPQQPRNLLQYGELRLWALARKGNWGPDGTERFSVRVGTDPSNFYLYQSKLRPATGPRQAVIPDWLPELIIDVDEWLALKAEAERRLVERPAASGDTLWNADSTYAIVLQDRARAPNLAAVRELVFAVYNAGDVATDGEVWIDEFRLGQPDREPDVAGNVGLEIVAGDLMTASVTLANQGATFRQMNEAPTYVQGRDFTVNSETRLGRLLPQRWGIELPVSVSHSRNDQTPTFLQQSDVLADRLDGLRESGYSNTRIGARLAKRTPTANPLLSLLLDGSQLRMAYNTGAANTVTTRSETRGLTGDLSYRRDIAPRTLPLPWAGLLAAIAPDLLENSGAFQRLMNAQLRWTPSTISFGSSYSDHLARTYRFDRILQLPGDTAVAIESPRQALRNDVTVGLQPFQPLTLSLGLSSDRDLLDVERATTRDEEREALQRELWAPGGLQLGWETARALNTTLSYRPEIASWLRGSYTFSNRYLTDRNPSYIEMSPDSIAQMQRRFESSRQTSRTLQVLPRQLPGALALDTTGRASRLIRRLEPVDITWRNTLASSFDRELMVPGLGYQLGLGDANAFRFIGADTAVRAQQRDEFRISSGVQLITGTQVTVGYTDNRTETWDARGGTRTVEQVGWPALNLNMREVPIPAFAANIVSTVEMSVGFQRNQEATRIAGTEQRREVENVRIPFSTRIGFMRGVSFSYRGSVADGETFDPTGDSRSATADHNLALTGVLPVPESMRGRFTQPFGLSLRYSDTMQRLCRFGAASLFGDGCVSYVDVATRTLNFGINSKVRDVQVDLDLSYVNRANLVGTRNGSSQFQLNLRGSFLFEAGQIPTLIRPR